MIVLCSFAFRSEHWFQILTSKHSFSYSFSYVDLGFKKISLDMEEPTTPFTVSIEGAVGVGKSRFINFLKIFKSGILNQRGRR